MTPASDISVSHLGSNRIASLDGWRAVCALWVIGAHLLEYSSLRTEVFGPNIDMGPLGVEFFFGISGFVIGRGLAREDRPNMSGFYIRRFFRIIPPLVLYLSAVSILAVLGLIPVHALGVWRSLTFTCDVAGTDCGGWFGAHLWSLSAEEQFYLLAPLLFLLVRRRGPLTILMLAPAPLTLAFYGLGMLDAGFIAVHFVTIGLGVAAALNEGLVRRWVAKIPWWSVLPALAIIVCLWSIPEAKTRVWGMAESRWANGLRIIVVDPLIVFVLMTSSLDRSPIGALLRAPFLQALGAVSYSVYLWQQLATGPYPGATPAFYVVSLGLCLGLAFVSFHAVEARLIALGGRLSGRVAKRGAVSSNLQVEAPLR